RRRARRPAAMQASCRPSSHSAHVVLVSHLHPQRLQTDEDVRTDRQICAVGALRPVRHGPDVHDCPERWYYRTSLAEPTHVADLRLENVVFRFWIARQDQVVAELLHVLEAGEGHVAAVEI